MGFGAQSDAVDASAPVFNGGYEKARGWGTAGGDVAAMHISASRADLLQQLFVNGSSAEQVDSGHSDSRVAVVTRVRDLLTEIMEANSKESVPFFDPPMRTQVRRRIKADIIRAIRCGESHLECMRRGFRVVHVDIDYARGCVHIDQDPEQGVLTMRMLDPRERVRIASRALSRSVQVRCDELGRLAELIDAETAHTPIFILDEDFANLMHARFEYWARVDVSLAMELSTLRRFATEAARDLGKYATARICIDPIPDRAQASLFIHLRGKGGASKRMDVGRLTLEGVAGGARVIGG